MRRDFRPYGGMVVGLTAAVTAFLVLPIIVIFYYSVQDNTYFQLVPRGLSWRWFVTAWENERFVAAAVNSLITALIVTPLSVALAIPTGFVLVRYNIPLRNVVNVLIMSPLLVPGVVSGIAFLTFFGYINLAEGGIKNVVAMLCFTFPFAVRAIVANLQGIGLVWEEAGESLGATRWQVWLWILLPMLRPGMLAASIFVFVETVDNFSITVFLVSRASMTIPIEVYNYIKDFDDPSVAVVAVVSVIASTALMFLVERLIGLDRFLRNSA
ncbi:ABC transporter permease [Ferrovibrio sp.]|uniref:ABC transporter permease n=1 Tax=Ferrovibrio sp. TaxID=1917215 RepID=UPI003D2951C6